VYQAWALLEDRHHSFHVLTVLLNNLGSNRIARKMGMLDFNSWIEIFEYSAQIFVFRHSEGSVAICDPLDHKRLENVLVKPLDVLVRNISLSIFHRVQAQGLLNGLLLVWQCGWQLGFPASLNLVSSLFLRTFAFSRRCSDLVLVK
jgi:hypothetical protein